jgi:spermidine dehydrogenase
LGKREDRTLGMDRPIARRDFLEGAALGVAGVVTSGLPVASVLAAIESAASPDPANYPPMRLGMRGSHPGSFEMAHALRDPQFWSNSARVQPTGEDYDLVVVGAGISGLAAAHFYRAAARGARVLILDNHDDFGGHAKRNEFHVGGRMLLMNGGTWSIESPKPYSRVADGLLKELGVDPTELERTCVDRDYYASLGLRPGVFFDRETFGVDRLVPRGDGESGTREFLERSPLAERVRSDILRIEHGTVDPMPGLTSDQKKDALSRMSYQRYLLEVLRADQGVIPFYRHATDTLWGCGIDAISALDCWGVRMPGFDALGLAAGAAPRMGYTPAGYAATGGSYWFHFPDGNASIARLLVRKLVPGALTGSSARDIVTARADYSRLDVRDAPVRIRLSSIVLRVRNIESGGTGKGVEIAYGCDGRLCSVRARHCVLAGWNMMIPYLCPEPPETQKAALHALVKTPLVYANVALRNWTAFERLKVWRVSAPGSYFSSFGLNETVDIGTYRSSRTPDEPMLIRMERTPAQPGLDERAQHRAGRTELLSTSFETFERNIRDELNRALSGGGFDAARDIDGIAVNRWPHGYAPEYNSLIDGDTPPARMPNLIGRARFGHIAIANADSGMAAYTDVAIDMAHRAVAELLGG